VLRLLALLSLVALLLWSCGPDARTCSGPNFRVVLQLLAGPLPADTVVQVTYGGSAVETFRLSNPGAPNKVVFCRIVDESGAVLDASTAVLMAAAGSAGDSDQPAPEVAAIHCDLWTAGFTELKVTGAGFGTVITELVPKDGVCPVDEPVFLLDSPDAGWFHSRG
jgi:hypothetical protein